jgi:hypothetical protein
MPFLLQGDRSSVHVLSVDGGLWYRHESSSYSGSQEQELQALGRLLQPTIETKCTLFRSAGPTEKPYSF